MNTITSGERVNLSLCFCKIVRFWVNQGQWIVNGRFQRCLGPIYRGWCGKIRNFLLADLRIMYWGRMICGKLESISKFFANISLFCLRVRCKLWCPIYPNPTITMLCIHEHNKEKREPLLQLFEFPFCLLIVKGSKRLYSMV